MNKIVKMAAVVAVACDGRPLNATLLVMLWFIGFSFVEAAVETLIFGHRFEHLLDIIFSLVFMLFAAIVVWQCAVYQINKGANK